MHEVSLHGAAQWPRALDLLSRGVGVIYKVATKLGNVRGVHVRGFSIL